jgi:hypothetical protein
MDLMASEISKNKAQAMVNLTKAKEKNIEANKEAETPPEMPEGTDPALTEAQVAAEQSKAQGQDIKNQQLIEENRRKEEKHQQELEQGHQTHVVELAKGAEEHNVKIGLKKAEAVHGMKMKEKAANKPKPKPTKEGGSK